LLICWFTENCKYRHILITSYTIKIKQARFIYEQTDLPMYRKFTQKVNDNDCRIAQKIKMSKPMSPRKETLSFLMQFSRSYHVEKELPESLSGMVLN